MPITNVIPIGKIKKTKFYKFEYIMKYKVNYVCVDRTIATEAVDLGLNAFHIY